MILDLAMAYIEVTRIIYDSKLEYKAPRRKNFSYVPEKVELKIF